MHPRHSVPSHVPPALVRHFDIYQIEVGDDPQRDYVERLRDEPPIFYVASTARNGYGSWVVVRREPALEIFQDPATFSSRHIAGFDRVLGDEEWLAYPVEADPPDHGKFRSVLNPLFSPARIRQLESHMRAHTAAVIEEVVPAGQVDFVQLASKLPAGIFSHLLGISVDETLAVMSNVRRFLHSGYDQAQRKAGIQWLKSFELELLERRRRERGDDLISLMLDARIEGRPFNDKELFGMFFFFLLAGMDTVAGALGLHFHHLARHPALRKRLIAQPQDVPATIEELLRRYSQITTNRFVTCDVGFHGVQMRTGDNVILLLPTANLDALAFEDPLTVDVDRAANAHIAFGAGPHRCIGSNIARQQLRITYEEWLRRIADFEVTPGRQARAVCSEALVLTTLPLSWKCQR